MLRVERFSIGDHPWMQYSLRRLAS